MKRLEYIDALRGLGILMVVYHHICVMSMRNTLYESCVNSFIITVFMPLFFFIGGFVAYKKIDWTLSTGFKIIANKTRTLLVPFISMFLFCMIYYKLDIYQYIIDHYKCGFWFIWVLYQIFIIWILINILYHKLRTNKKHYFITGGIIFSFFIMILSHKLSYNNPIIGFFSLDFTCQFLFYFLLGSFFKKYVERFNALCSNREFIIIIFLLSFLQFTGVDFPLIQHITTISRIILLYIVFYTYRDYFATTTNCSKALTYIGKHTLEIYLIHYFLLFKIDNVANYLYNLQNSYCFRGGAGLFPEILIIGTLAIVISFSCIIIRKIIDTIPYLSMLCFGTKK